jgi:tyrosinase
MGRLQTAVRDPAFFRWHKYVDELFLPWFDTQGLATYTKHDLIWSSMNLQNIQLIDKAGKATHTLRTLMSQDTITLKAGLDFGDNPTVSLLNIKQ